MPFAHSFFRALAVVALATGAFAPGGGSAKAGDSPMVIELFTSQGCSSCPPADALLAKLARQPGVTALS